LEGSFINRKRIEHNIPSQTIRSTVKPKIVSRLKNGILVLDNGRKTTQEAYDKAWVPQKKER